MIIIGSPYEHDCLERYIDIHVNTVKDLEYQLQSHPNEDKYVCWMLVNNLTGIVFDVKFIGKLCKKYDAWFICDMTSAVGHVTLPDNIEDWCSCCFASSHKFHGEKNNGFMWVSDSFAEHLGLTESSKDEYGLRWGTPDVAGAIAMSYAMDDACKHYKAKERYWEKLYLHLLEDLKQQDIKVKAFPADYGERYGYLTPTEWKAKTYAINAIILPNINAEALQTYLATKSIYIGIGGSACAEARDYRVLNSFGLTDEEAERTIRVSFNRENTEDDIDKLVEGIVEFKNKFII